MSTEQGRVRLTLPRLHAEQQRIRDRHLRYSVVRAGRRFGKTALGLDLLIDDALLTGKPVAWFAPAYRYVTEVWNEAKRSLAPLITHSNKTELRMELVTGGTLEFWTLDGPDPARGRKYRRVIVDEAAMVRDLKTRWEQAIRPTLTDLRGDAFFFSTPKGRGNFFAELCGRGNERQRLLQGWQEFHAPTASNPFIPPDEIEAARSELPDLVFRQEYLAEFVDLAGGVVDAQWIRIGGPPPGLTLVMGVDLAISVKDDADFTAIAVLGRDPQTGVVYVVDVRRRRATFHGALEFIREMAAEHRPSVIAVEQVQYQAAAVQELTRTTTLPVRGVRPDKDKLMRFAGMLSRYEQGLVRHAATLPADFRDELLSFPVGAHDDQVDALAYAFSVLPTDGPPLATAGSRVFGGSTHAYSLAPSL